MPSWSDCRLRGIVNVAPRRPRHKPFAAPVQRLATTSKTGREEEVHAPVSGVSGEARAQGGRRGLSTAHAVLQVLSFLEQHPDGVRAEEVTEFVGKSASTAYHLLASLVDEGFAVHESGLYRARHAVAPAPRGEWGRSPHPLEDAVDDLFLRTHKRCYLGVVRGGVIEITVVRGRQGIARMPGLGTQISDNAHALAMGKVVLARLRPEALARYVGSGHALHAEHDHLTRQALAGAPARPRRRLRGRARGVRPRLLLRRGAGARRARAARRRARAVGVDARVRQRARRAHRRGARHRRRRRTRPGGDGFRPDGAVRMTGVSSIVRKSTSFLSPHRASHSLLSPLLSTPGTGAECCPFASTRRRSRQ